MSMWSSGVGTTMYPGQLPYNQAGYGQPGYGQPGYTPDYGRSQPGPFDSQSYERLQQGEPLLQPEDPRSPQATQSFTSRYYDSQYATDDFPKPVGTQMSQRMASAAAAAAHDQGSFQSVALQSAPNSFSAAGPGTERVTARPPPYNRGKGRPPAGPDFDDCGGHCKRAMLWFGALMVAVVAIGTLFCVFVAVRSTNFSTFSRLAWESWYPSFWAMLLVLGLFPVLAMAAAVLGAVAGIRETRTLLRFYACVAATMGVLLLLIAFFCWLYGLHARPAVARAANLMCQEVDIWGCQAPPPAPAPSPRRLASVNHVVVNFRARLDKEPGGVCKMVENLCKAPPGFDPNVACVCSGQWDYAPPSVPAPAPAPAPLPPGQQQGRRLGEPTFEGRLSNWSAGREVANAPAPQPARRLQNQSEYRDPWQGSIGAYCEKWTSKNSTEDAKGEWCFVSSLQLCGVETQAEYLTSKGFPYHRSQAPCTNAVQTRSWVVIAGLQEFFLVLRMAAGLGVVLLFSSCCGAALYQSPAKLPAPWADPHASRIPHQDPVNQLSPEELAEMRFEDAQREAVAKLSQQTPEDIKLMLYGFYKQAKEGDVKGERPGFWNTRERAKYDFWARHQGMSRTQAIEGYIRTVAMLD